MAQLVARLVRNEKVGGSNPPSSTTGRHPNRMSVFCMPGRAVAAPGCRVAVLLVVPLVFRHSVALLCGFRPLRVPVGGGPPARSPHASLRLGVVDLEARPGPAAAHRHRGRVLHALRRPSHLWGLRCCVWWRVVLMPAPALPPPTGTVAGLFSACLPSRPTKPAAYVDRLLRYG